MFRNLTLFRFSRDVATDLQRLDEVLADHRLRACGPLEMFTHGFVPPVGIDAEAPLTRTVLSTSGRFTWFTVGAEDNVLQAKAVSNGATNTLALSANTLAATGALQNLQTTAANVSSVIGVPGFNPI